MAEIVVTGAFSYSGQRITSKLLDDGHAVRTITAHPDRPHHFGDRVQALPLAFDDPAGLERSLAGADVLINTYWVRFNRGRTNFDRAVANTFTLFDAARRAGVARVVHLSITNSEAGAGLPYFEGKAAVERWLTSSGMSHAIVRPTVMFGHGDVFINNMAWLLRKFPVFAVPGNGNYRLQPVFVDDVADLCSELAVVDGNMAVDAAGPEVFTFEELLLAIKTIAGATSVLVHVPPRLAVLAAKVIGAAVRDVLLNPTELEGLMRELIVSSEASRCPTKLTEWLSSHSEIGRRYESELTRNYAPSEVRIVGLSPL